MNRIAPNNQLLECYFTPNTKLTSATICINCNREKFLHTIGYGIKPSSVVIIQTKLPTKHKF